MLVFPSAVKVRNIRLQLCRNLLMILALSIIIVNFLIFANFVIEDPITGHVQTSISGSYRWGMLNDAHLGEVTSPTCTRTDRYSFWPTASGSIRFDNFSCMAPCPEGRTHADCINQHSMSFQEGAQSSVIVTSLRQTFLKGKSSNGTDDHRTDNYLVPAASALSLDILYTLKLGTIEMSSYFDTTTVALKSDGTVWKRFDASNSHVSLTLSELLSLAGVRLDDTMPVVGRNYFPNALESSGPLARVAGLNLDIEIKCGRKPRAFFWDTAALPTEKHPDVECSLQVKTSPSFMVSVVRFESDQSVTRVRSYQGVRFTSSFSGTYKRLNLNSVLVNITTAVTFLSIPNQVIFVMAMWFLAICLESTGLLFKENSISARSVLQCQCA